MSYFTRHPSPIGPLLLVANEQALTGVYMEAHKHGKGPDADWQEAPERFTTVKAQLDEYFAGHRRTFDLPISASGTAFQSQVWDVLRRIPFGETWSYLRVANELGRPSAVRAVGAANGRNPLSIVVPCHRVIGADGSLTGYAGGEARKRWLLDHEQR